MSIYDLLTNWKSESFLGERQFEKQSFTLIEGQELYLISVKFLLTFDGQSRLIEKQKFFQSRVQGFKNQGEIKINPKADEYICLQILKQLEKEFYEEYSAFIEEVVKYGTKY